jgi:hypothetical protein
MTSKCLRVVAAAIGAAAILYASILPVQAQGSDQKPAEPPKGQSGQGGDAGKTESPNRSDEIAEAGRALTGPAANPECVWLGQRVVGLLWRDDLDTAFRHLDLYDRFGCPAGHIQATFRCLVRQGAIDPKQPETLNGRVHACWINPEGDATASAPAATVPAPAAAAPSGTVNR